MRTCLLTAIVLVLLAAMPAFGQSYYGRPLGAYSANPYVVTPYSPNSLSNPYGAGNPYRADGLLNPYSPYGNPYSNRSWSNPYATEAPKIYGRGGTYYGRLSTNRYDADSISNPYGRYGNPYSPDSLANPYGAGNPYGSESFDVWGDDE